MTRPPADPIRLAMVGCGAITEIGHLPAAGRLPGLTVTALVDPDTGRAEKLAARFGVGVVRPDVAGLADVADAAVIAAPNALHARLALDLITQGMHVLVEKPLALTAADAHHMVSAAAAAGVVLAVGLVRRFAAWAELVATALRRGWVGPVRRFAVREGFRYDWPATTASFWRRDQAGGGVLADTGPHALDLLDWWLGGIQVAGYQDDAVGGVEADCAATLSAPHGATGTLDLSRTRDLGFEAWFEGPDGRLTVAGRPYAPRVELSVGGTVLSAADVPAGDIMAASLGDFTDAIRHARPPRVTGTDGLRAVELVERCYAVRTRLPVPWEVIASPQLPTA